jgi:hypothetical protein
MLGGDGDRRSPIAPSAWRSHASTSSLAMRPALRAHPGRSLAAPPIGCTPPCHASGGRPPGRSPGWSRCRRSCPWPHQLLEIAPLPTPMARGSSASRALGRYPGWRPRRCLDSMPPTTPPPRRRSRVPSRWERRPTKKKRDRYFFRKRWLVWYSSERRESGIGVFMSPPTQCDRGNPIFN